MKPKKLQLYSQWMIIFSILVLFVPINAKELKGKVQIGILQWAESPANFTWAREGFIEGMEELSISEGEKNVQFNIGIAEGSKEKAKEIAQEFVNKKVDLIYTIGTIPSLLTLETTKEIPIIYMAVDPKATGIIESWISSGRNVTGVSVRIPKEKQLEMLKKAIPNIKRIGILYSSIEPQVVVGTEEAKHAAKKLGMTPHSRSLNFDRLNQLPSITKDLAQKVDAIYIPNEPVLTVKKNLLKIIEVTNRAKIPVIVPIEEGVELGALMALHCDFNEIGKQAATISVKVLKGIKPTDIPSQMPMVHRLTVNLKTAKRLGITINPQFLSLVHRVIE